MSISSDLVGQPGFTAGLVHRILIVDERTEIPRLRDVLTEAGYSVDVCESGGQASATFKVSRPDFVILELLLPGESGFEICERMKRIDAAVPILGLTVLDLDSGRNLGVRVGLDAYLTKPFEDAALCEMVRDVAESVWKRNHGGQTQEAGRIRFVCRCGQKVAVHIRDKGKTMHCPECRAALTVPFWVGSRAAKFFMPREQPLPLPESSLTLNPLNYVTVRCTDCGTYYRLFVNADRIRQKCPRCGTIQRNALSLGDSPLSRAALVSSRRLMLIRSGKQKGKKYLLPNREVVVGSDPACDIRWASESTAERHCALRPSAEGPLVRDLGTTAGTFVNASRIDREMLLRPGDLLEVAGLKLELAAHNLNPCTDGINDVAFLDRTVESPVDVRADLTTDAFDSTADEAAKVALQFWDRTRSLRRDEESKSTEP